MAWLPLYASEQDLCQLLEHLNASSEIAFVVSRGPGKWGAVSSMEVLAQGRYCLWHIPSGPLPLFRGAKEKPGEIANPFTGWSEVKAGANPSEPYFGAGHPGLFWLNINVIGTPREGTPVVGLSSFEWIGNHYKMIGSPAPHATELFWKSLQRWVKKTATKVARGGPAARTAPEIWALPGAQALFESGAKGGNI